MKTATLPRRMPTTYQGLVRMLAPRPIRDDTELRNVTEIVDRLALLSDLSQDQADYLEVLTTLIEFYEREHHDIDVSGLTSLDVLKHLLDENGMNGSDLGRLLGNRQLGSAILRGRRQLSKAHVKVLSNRFCVDADLFLA